MWHADDGQLNALLDGELSPDELREVQAHLAGCPECARRLEEARSFLAEAGELLAVLSPETSATARPVMPAAAAAAPPPKLTVEEPPLVAPLSRGPAESGSTKKDDRSTTPRIAATAKEVAISLEGRTALTPAIRPVHRSEAPPAPKRRWQMPSLEKMAWAASLILCIGVGYLANEVKNLNRQRVPTDLATSTDAPQTADTVAQLRDAAANRSAAGSGSAAERRGAPASVRVQPPAAPRSEAPARARADGDEDPTKPRVPATKPPPNFARPQPNDMLAGSAAPAQGAQQPPPAPAAALAPFSSAAGPPVSQPTGDASGAGSRDVRARQAQRPNELGRAAAPAAVAPPTANSLEEINVTTGAMSASSTPLTSFRRITIDEAVRRLSGTIRLIDGLNPTRVEAGPGRLVPGADPERDVIRVIYTDAQGSRVTLDQQVGDQRVGSFNGLMPGDTLVTAVDAGGTRVRWVDRKFWLSISGSVDADSLRAFVARVR